MALKQYGNCEGPLGFPMRSDVAHYVDEVLKGLPQDCKDAGFLHVVKVATSQDFVEGERADVAFITTESLDRDGEVMLVKGGDFSQFRKNPVVTFAHKYDKLPVGRAMWLKREEKNGLHGWTAKTGYIARPTDWPTSAPWFPDAVWHYVRTRNLPGKSLGFIPLEMRAPDEKELSARPELKDCRRIIPKWLALEYAVCPVPCNPDALTMATAKARQQGIQVPDLLLEEFGMVIPDTFETKPKPKPDEPRKEFMDRCIPMVIAEGTAKDPKQAVAICSSMWEQKPKDLRELVRKGIAQGLKDMDLGAMMREELNRMRGRV